MINQLNERSRQIFRFIVDSYLSTGSPVGSRTISTLSGINLSAASIRNTMSDLETAGLLFSPHTSAGRLPTEQGLRLYIDGLMQVGGLSKEERQSIEATCVSTGRPINEVLERSTALLSGLSSCASLVIAPKTESSVRQIQFVQIQPRRILAVIVLQNGLVENRIMEVEQDLPPETLTSAANYLNAKLAGKTIAAAEAEIEREIHDNQSHLDTLAQKLVRIGLALPSRDAHDGHIIVRGQSRLLQDVKALEDLERARALLGYLEEQKHMLEILSAIDRAEGVQIFLGTENKIFNQSGWSMIISPYKNAEEQIIGAIGVIGPTRLDYDRIIPMVDYTSRLVGRMFGKMVDEL
ncbi:MAG: heat-inducible transcriptional repressor HrcA [Alphaproteobacteria bacterium]|nr:heat-inducible transcriptional repressor HrcA [Alphaproteobacteria bacterium]